MTYPPNFQAPASQMFADVATQIPPAPPSPNRHLGLRFAALVVVALLMSVMLPSTLAGSVASARTAAYPKPAISIASTNGNPRAGDAVTFSATHTSGTNLRYVWDFGDGSGEQVGQQVQHAFQSYGSYTISLSATDPIGQAANATLTINVTPQAPTPSFTYSADPNNPLAITFDASSSGGVQLSYQWNYGDGNTDTGVTANHTYQATGTYTVTLTVTDIANQTVTTSQQVQVSVPKPTAAFAASPQGFDCVSFDASASIGYQITYTWDFGDGNSDTSTYSSFDSHCYANNGSYTVTLTITDGVGQTAKVAHSVTASS